MTTTRHGNKSITMTITSHGKQVHNHDDYQPWKQIHYQQLVNRMTNLTNKNSLQKKSS